MSRGPCKIILSKCRYHAEAEIRPHHCDTIGLQWWSTLAACQAANIVQVVHRRDKCVHGAAPSYLAEMCIPVVASTGRRFLRSASHGDLMVHWARTSTYGQRSFAVSRTSVWNDLPPTLRASSMTLGQFQNKLKTVLFCSAYETWSGALVTVYGCQSGPLQMFWLTYLLIYLQNVPLIDNEWFYTL